ncbi:MAG: hypothetical protein LBV61_10085 [Burkholderiaceae bacterium]|nr:hypothetical protein [Burkholderiaceae bacterium]
MSTNAWNKTKKAVIIMMTLTVMGLASPYATAEETKWCYWKGYYSGGSVDYTPPNGKSSNGQYYVTGTIYGADPNMTVPFSMKKLNAGTVTARIDFGDHSWRVDTTKKVSVAPGKSKKFSVSSKFKFKKVWCGQ